MQGDRPLLIKLSVNLTPHGTMIFIPAYWSFDAKRDVRWDAAMKLHRARAAKKQGPVLAEGVEDRRALAKKLETLDREVRRRGLRGAARHAFLCAGSRGRIPSASRGCAKNSLNDAGAARGAPGCLGMCLTSVT